MDNENLLQQFSDLLDRYERHRGYIEKARAQAGKFSQAVIEKVCLDNELKSQEVAEEIRPLVGELVRLADELDAEIEGIRNRTSEASERMEELELRLAIGELDPETYEEQSASLKEELGTAEQRISELAESRDAYRKLLDRWTEAARAAGHETGLPGEAREEPPVEPRGEGEHAARVEMQEDVSAVFRSAALGTASVQVPDDEEEVAIEAFDAVDEEVSVDVSFGAVEVEEEVPIDLDDNVVELDAGVVEEAPSPAPVRKALLLRQEGTADEQVYPIQGDEVWIGRGRDNDIRVTGDSKVSRRHCRIYRKGDAFYIQDNKSSNGSLVNGEMITERRLFGGEEIIVGETFFRFRIMD